MLDECIEIVRTECKIYLIWLDFIEFHSIQVKQIIKRILGILEIKVNN